MATLEGFTKLQTTVAKIDEKKALVECNKKLCEDASDRLTVLFKLTTACKDEDKQKAATILTPPVKAFLQMLREQHHYKYSLYWLGMSQRLIEQARKVHESVDATIIALGLEQNMKVAEWDSLVLDGCQQQQNWLIRHFREQSKTELIGEVNNPHKLKQALLFIQNQLKLRYDDNTAGQTRATVSITSGEMEPEMSELMRSTLQRLAGRATIDPTKFYPWYIAKEYINLGKQNKKIGVGTFGSVYEATLTHERTGKKWLVAIKTLDANIPNVDEDATFSREIEAWVNLAMHRHVLKLFGANHASQPRFFVMEYAAEGNLEVYFKDEDKRQYLWHYLGQAAQGLSALHNGEQPVEHGGLKTNNILLAKDGESGELVAKISDFGMSVIRTESVQVSAQAKGDSSIWRAPERLNNSSDPIDFRKADIYCLGLCVIDAASGEPPFGFQDPETIVGDKIDGKRVPRPEQCFSTEEWAFVDRMCDPDPNLRPSLDEVIARMADLDEIRQDAWLTGSFRADAA